jgi:hypothetical protein
MTTLDHDEPENVGGPLDLARLQRIAVRGWWLRNRFTSESEALDFDRIESDAFGGGETPVLVWREGDRGETSWPSIEIHMGCGDACPVAAIIPYDGDSGGVDQRMAEAIAHAGRDLLDLTREVVELRRLVNGALLLAPSADEFRLLVAGIGGSVDKTPKLHERCDAWARLSDELRARAGGAG